MPAPILKNVTTAAAREEDASRERRLSVAVVDQDMEINIEQRRTRRRHRSRSRPKVVALRDTWTELSREAIKSFYRTPCRNSWTCRKISAARDAARRKNGPAKLSSTLKLIAITTTTNSSGQFTEDVVGRRGT
ncbi:hypothetical protein MY5147_009690 [Beauveria neobassiana]